MKLKFPAIVAAATGQDQGGQKTGQKSFDDHGAKNCITHSRGYPDSRGVRGFCPASPGVSMQGYKLYPS